MTGERSVALAPVRGFRGRVGVPRTPSLGVGLTGCVLRRATFRMFALLITPPPCSTPTVPSLTVHQPAGGALVTYRNSGRVWSYSNISGHHIATVTLGRHERHS